MAADPRRYAPAAARNRDPILAVLRRVLPASGLVLEIASGTGEHVAHFARALPDLDWQPSDRDNALFASIVAHGVDLADGNFLPPLCLDAAAADWPVTRVDAIVCINMIHISPWSACEGLMRGAGRVLAPAGVLYLYGPYTVDGCHTADSNAAFDEGLRVRDPDWGVRDLGAVTSLAATHDLRLDETIAMPANNLSLVLRKR
jgi:SAM-dependent methyltransferase